MRGFSFAIVMVSPFCWVVMTLNTLMDPVRSTNIESMTPPVPESAVGSDEETDLARSKQPPRSHGPQSHFTAIPSATITRLRSKTTLSLVNAKNSILAREQPSNSGRRSNSSTINMSLVCLASAMTSK
ncbi:uncharacterized protein BJ171DRAFT_495572 [Polychytrium aggregatum]|uniref:uncharacterized protein n=1 Tax=Polychytrium aggregatum TaxID=110093 RepID=UPI0022FEA904|nr:uncharacterized protein BJ171DRAFT_495572 [Polychytrium aggregatum]KAI9207069.1 hypothetical protein BJ171DRAFT_495572 [Polychytrium aggregatum]